jgi:hypothetical protein
MPKKVREGVEKKLLAMLGGSKELLKMQYPGSKIRAIERKVLAKVQRETISIDADSIKGQAMSDYQKLVYQAANYKVPNQPKVSSDEMTLNTIKNETDPYKNIATKLNGKVPPRNIRTAIGQSKTLAKKAVVTASNADVGSKIERSVEKNVVAVLRSMGQVQG